MHEPGSREVRRLGLEVKYKDESGVSIADVFPKTTLLNVLSGEITGELTAAIDFGGHLSATPISAGSAELPVELGGGARLHVAGKAEVLATVSLSLVTPIVEAIGDGDSFAQWMLTRHKVPLWGDHAFFQVLLVPPGIRSLSYEARVSARVTRYGVVESVRRSGWIELRCQLVSGATAPPGGSVSA